MVAPPVVWLSRVEGLPTTKDTNSHILTLARVFESVLTPARGSG